MLPYGAIAFAKQRCNCTICTQQTLSCSNIETLYGLHVVSVERSTCFKCRIYIFRLTGVIATIFYFEGLQINSFHEKGSVASSAISFETPDAATFSKSLNVNLNKSQRRRLLLLLNKFRSSFNVSCTGLDKINQVIRRIETEPGSIIRHRAHCVAPSERHTINVNVMKVLEKKVIRESSRPWASPVVLVKNKSTGVYTFASTIVG